MNPIFSFANTVANSKFFNSFIIITILLAGVVVGVQTYEATSQAVRDLSPMLNLLDKAILAIFTVEVVLKVLAEGKKPWRYFSDPWNIFDFSIVFVCYLAFFMPKMDADFIAILRLARILRVFKLVKALPKLQLLVNALLKSIPSMFYVSILLFLMFYMYAVMGVFMFGVNDPVHFQTLPKASLSLFRIITLEDWTDVMYINMYGCNHEIWGYSQTMGCTSPAPRPWISPIFFVSFVMIGTMIVLNLFIGVIMKAMEEASAEAEEMDAQANPLANSQAEQLNQQQLLAVLNRMEKQMNDMQKSINDLNKKQ